MDPANHVQSLTLKQINSLEIDGLTAGLTYYITIAANNFAGRSPAAPALSGVFGPLAMVSGHAVQGFELSDGKHFDIDAVQGFELSDGKHFDIDAEARKKQSSSHCTQNAALPPAPSPLASL